MGEILQLVVPEQKRAPVVEQYVEGQVVGVAPLCSDRARKPRHSERSSDSSPTLTRVPI